MKQRCEWGIVPKAAWDWGGDSSVANDPFGTPDSILYICLPPAWVCWWCLFNSPVLVGLIWTTRNYRTKWRIPSKEALQYMLFIKRLIYLSRGPAVLTNHPKGSWQLQPTWGSWEINRGQGFTNSEKPTYQGHLPGSWQFLPTWGSWEINKGQGFTNSEKPTHQGHLPGSQQFWHATAGS
jgi:hypothetical protein